MGNFMIGLAIILLILLAGFSTWIDIKNVKAGKITSTRNIVAKTSRPTQAQVDLLMHYLRAAYPVCKPLIDITPPVGLLLTLTITDTAGGVELGSHTYDIDFSNIANCAPMIFRIIEVSETSIISRWILDSEAI